MQIRSYYELNNNNSLTYTLLYLAPNNYELSLFLRSGGQNVCRYHHSLFTRANYPNHNESIAS